MTDEQDTTDKINPDQPEIKQPEAQPENKQPEAQPEIKQQEAQPEIKQPEPDEENQTATKQPKLKTSGHNVNDDLRDDTVIIPIDKNPPTMLFKEQIPGY